MDTEGSERYHSVVPSFFRNASVVCVIYDVTNRESFEKLAFWFNLAEQSGPSQVPIIVVGNKIDLENKRQVSFDEGKLYCNNMKAHAFLETSAKTGEAVDGLFTLVASVEGTFAQDPFSSSPVPEESMCC